MIHSMCVEKHNFITNTRIFTERVISSCPYPKLIYIIYCW